MNEARIVVEFISAALVAGVNIQDFLQRISTLIEQRHAAGGTLSYSDLDLLFKAGDELEAAQLARVRAALEAQAKPG
jgi:hypothetical protein